MGLNQQIRKARDEVQILGKEAKQILDDYRGKPLPPHLRIRLQAYRDAASRLNEKLNRRASVRRG